MLASDAEISAFLQRNLAILGLVEVPAVQAARWLDEGGLLADSPARPGKPLRDRLRAGRIASAEQRPSGANGRWFILRADHPHAPADATAEARPEHTRVRTGVREADAHPHRWRCSAEEVARALDALALNPRQVNASDWPGGLTGLNQCGLYSWWVDDTGARNLSAGLGLHLNPGRVYAGQTGATKWPSGKPGSQTLSKRIGGNHLRGTIRGSTFRLTLAASLLEPLALTKVTAKRVDAASEQRLTSWIRKHLAVAVLPFPYRDALGDLERRVLAELDPPLNLDGMAPSAIRQRLSRRRAELA
jgi:hypothetical protein